MAWTLTQLETFRAVAEGGSMHAAAERLGYTPGAVSQQMAALSRAVGGELFLRSGRGVVLSDAGHGFLPLARRVLEEDRAARRALAELRTGRATVRVGIFETAGAVSCREVLRRAAVAEPPVDVVFEEVDVERAVDAVRAGTVDLALSVHYELVPVTLPPGVVATELLTEPFVEVRAADLVADAPWIVPPATETFGMAVQAALRRAGEDTGTAHVVTDTALMVALAEAGVGRALVTPPDAEGAPARPPGAPGAPVGSPHRGGVGHRRPARTGQCPCGARRSGGDLPVDAGYGGKSSGFLTH